MAWYWWLLVGILIGWLLSTLIEWLWFRRKRMEVRDERVAELENALRASADDGLSPTRGAGAALTGAAAASAAGITATLADKDVTLAAPDLDAAVDMPDIDMPDVDLPDADLPDMSTGMSGLTASIDTAADIPDLDMPDIDMPDVDLPDVDLPDVSAGMSGLAASIDASVDMPDLDMPDADLPDVSAKLDVAKTGLGAAALAAGAAGIADDLAGADAPDLGDAVAVNTNYPDDLTEILGIGRVYETRLYRAGVYTWDQVANMTVSALEEATEAIDAANAQDWPAQAQTLAQANNRGGARYHGPLPDKLSALKGIGEGAEQQLYRAGILTFAQLAATTADELAAALPTYRGDFSDWIVQASAKL